MGDMGSAEQGDALDATPSTATAMSPAKLPCPQCGSIRSVVIDSRGRPNRRAVRRRRRCETCGEKFWTIEKIDRLSNKTHNI